MLRLSAKSLGLAAGLVLLAHGILLARGVHAPIATGAALILDALALAYLLAGRVVLSLLPPGDVGSHAWRDLPATAATSLALGRLSAELVSPWLPVHPLWIALFLALGRWFTLPGAMVPRHPPPSEAYGVLDIAVALAGSAWGIYLLLVEDSLLALTWLALCVLLFHVLGMARRGRAGRYALLVLAAALCPHGLFLALGPALGLGLGACFLIPWLRRADRRAGVIAMLGFGSVFAYGPSLLGLVATGVMVAFSHARQRRFAAIGGALAAFFFLVPRFLGGAAAPPRGRMLWLPEILGSALDTGVWGLAWPAVALALVLGALAFDWRAREWTVGTIEAPRREVQALLALVVLSAVALASPFSPWAEQEVLVILFTPCALLAGLLLIPAERAVQPA